ncbi:MAG: universal stress protein [Burkholderiales bacterium RIFCSPLOWO2_02_FULL_57_36]|nr:MAG: universal stress protein [Burkholderiales bacterium RIFCSPLOWO2_02_FULL_57_36]
MFKTILVPTDGSELSEKSIRGAVELAKLAGGRIIAISVAEPYPFTPSVEGAFAPDLNLYEKQMQKFAEMHVEKVAEIAAKAGVPCETHVAHSFNPYEEIVNAAREHHCDVILMASHGRKGLNKLFIGSETQKVLAHSSIPVMVFR